MAGDGEQGVEDEQPVETAMVPFVAEKETAGKTSDAATEKEPPTRAAVTEKQPSTPSKSTRKCRAGYTTPTKTKTKPNRWDCDHDSPGNFGAYDGSMGYFDSAYLEKTANWPKACAMCDVKFVNKKVANEGEYKVSAATPAYLCRNGANSQHPCCYGLCNVCRKVVVGASPRRKRIRKSFD